MDNIRRHFQLAQGPKPPMAESRSTFHTSVPLAGTLQGDIYDCCTSSANFLDFMIKFCGAGTHMAESFTKVFQNTPYSEAAGQFHNAMKELFMATSSVTTQMKSKLDTMLYGLLNKVDSDSKELRSQEHLQTLAKGYLHVIRLHCQFVLTSTEVLSQFYDYKKVDDLLHHGAPVRNENDSHMSALQSLAKLTVTETTKPADDVQQGQGQSGSHGSWPPQLVPVTNADKTSIPDIWSQKPPKHPGYGNQRSYITEGQPSRFGDIGSRAASSQSLKNQNDVKTSLGGQLPRTVHLGPCNRDENHAVTQEELDSVIDFLSGHHGNKPLESIPESMSLPPSCLPAAPPEPFYSQYPPVFTQQTSPVPPPPTSQPPPTMRENDYSNMNNASQHRLSDGALGEMVEKGEIGRNTWPHRGNPDNNMQQQFFSYGSASSFGSDPEFLNYVASIGALIGTGQSSQIWSAGSGDLKLHHSWPTQGFQNPEGRENLTGSWSGQQDTSSSDESANEEALLNTCLGADLANNFGTERNKSEPLENLVTSGVPGKAQVHGGQGGTQPKLALPPKQPWADNPSQTF